jgi:hypothetical protein
MTAEIFLPDVDRTRRAAGWILIGVTALPLGWLVTRVLEVGRVNGGAIFLFLVLGGLLALGLRFAFWPMEYLEIDLEGRTFNVIRKGKKIAAGALDALGPLEIRRRSRTVGTGTKRRTVVDYAVCGAAHSAIDLYAMKSPGRARQKMEALARAWNLPSKSWGGEVRLPDALDTPLHERLRGDGAARKPAQLPPTSGVRIEPVASGHALISTHRSWAPLATSAVFAGVTLFILRTALSLEGLDAFRDGDPMAMIFTALFGILLIGMLVAVLKGVRDTFFPGTVRIDDRGVSYRFRRMNFERIEEVTATYPIEIVGDRRTVVLAETFCPPAAIDAVSHELQRLIVEVGAAHQNPV